MSVNRVVPLVFLAVALATVLMLPALHAGCGEADTPAPPAEVEKPPPGDIPGLSADQSRAVAEYGYPDHFFISVDPYSSDRVERWTYFRLGQALDFDNGRLFGKEPVDDQSSQYPPTRLHPQDFDNTMTPAEATSLLGEPLFTHETSDSLMPENTILVYETAVLLFRGEKLMGVDTQVKPPALPAP
ncbi:MAG: hypothetical protein HPY75_05535 [Actinobacteria bacterium]|nr:hypothetical protein [Actinomycetota bacterium]